MNMEEDEAPVTLEQAGRIIGVTRQTVHRHVASGRIRAEQIGCRLFVKIGEAKRFRDSDRRPGRPRRSAGGA